MSVISNSRLISPKRSLTHSMPPSCCTVFQNGISQRASWRRRLAQSKVHNSVQASPVLRAVDDAAYWPISDETTPRSSAASDDVGTSRPCRTSVNGLVFAAAVWTGPEASWDEEQSWWSAGPLSWRTADEREQWKAEQQLLKQQKQVQAPCNTKAAPAIGEGLMSVDQEAVDIEQQWLQPPVLLEPPQ